MSRLCLLMSVVLVMMSCNVDDRELLSPDDLEAEIIELNWCSTVKDYYVPEVFNMELPLAEPQVDRRTGYRKIHHGDMSF